MSFTYTPCTHMKKLVSVCKLASHEWARCKSWTERNWNLTFVCSLISDCHLCTCVLHSTLDLCVAHALHHTCMTANHHLHHGGVCSKALACNGEQSSSIQRATGWAESRHLQCDVNGNVSRPVQKGTVSEPQSKFCLSVLYPLVHPHWQPINLY